MTFSLDIVTARQQHDRETQRIAEDRHEAARALLGATDWMVLRQVETGKPPPATVLQARKDARALLGGGDP